MSEDDRMSSTILKLMDKTEEVIRSLNHAIDKERKWKTKLQYERLLLLKEVFESMLPEKFFKETFAKFNQHAHFVKYYLDRDDFEMMAGNAEDLQLRDLPDIKTEIYEFIKTLPERGKPYCFKIGATCSKEIMVKPNRVFIGMPFRKKFADVYTHGIVSTLEKINLESWKADEEPSNIDIMCKICEHLQESQYVIINITGWNPNVLFELGLAYGLGKTVVLIKDKESGVPVDLKGMEYIEYESSEDLSRSLKKFFLKFK